MTTILTVKGVKKIKEELEYVISSKLPEVEQRLELIRKHGGDIKDATEERDFYKGRIPYLENMLATAKIIGRE
ncbi:hypothetical protein ABEW32_03485 [Paenibacillus jamilae]|uniref:hypothetical protein n=1 Tax=Paenibacillus jamilae TaxID=114136 RepID=UPI003D2E4F3D